MKLRMYSIFDRKAEVFNAPMCFVNDAICQRALTQIIPGDADMSKYPDDFDVYLVAEFDNAVGSVFPVDPVIAFRLSDLFAKEA